MRALYKVKKIFFVIFYLTFQTIIGQDIVINEFMANNVSTIQDSYGNYSDWIELHNTSNASINILGYALSDDSSYLNKWVFPEISIPPYGYLLIHASNQNNLDTNELHANFKISSSGEELFLSDGTGSIMDQTSSITLFDDESYGRALDGNINWVSMHTPTPNMSNNNSNHLIFSNLEGFYTDSFSLKINSLLNDTIYYTLNGDEPNLNSDIFTDSIIIYNKSLEPNIFSNIPTTASQNLISYKAWEAPSEPIDKATILRCASYSNGVRTSKVYTKTFFVDSNMTGKYTLPILSLITERENLFSLDSGLFVPGVNYNSNNPEWTGNYFKQGNNWERNIHIEYFEPDGNLGFSQNAGVRIHGGKTRQTTQKSLRLYARDRYDKKYFNYQLLPQKKINKYKRFILKTSMGGWEKQTMMKDILAQNISKSLNIDSQDFQLVIVFVNGEYWGIHSIRDRIDERYIAYTHNVDKDSVEFMEPGNISYNNLMEFIENNDLENEHSYAYVKTKIDIHNYMDYTIAELFLKNYDWPSNNMRLWRELPTGKWRWIFYDLDAGFGDVNFNMLNHATKNDPNIVWPNSSESTFLFRNLLKNKSFKSQFLDRYAYLLNNHFSSDITIKKLNSIKKIINSEISSHIKRWNYPSSKNSWSTDINEDLIHFLEKRPCIVSNNIDKFFNLINYYYPCNRYNTDNSLIISPNPNHGTFFIYNKLKDITNAKLTITSITGKIVLEKNNFNLYKYERKYINLSQISSGTYILNVISDEYSEQQKIIKIN